MKFKRYQFVTALLVVYGTFMTLYFGLDLLKAGQILRFWITFGAEVCVIILAFFALRKRERLRDDKKQNPPLS